MAWKARVFFRFRAISRDCKAARDCSLSQSAPFSENRLKLNQRGQRPRQQQRPDFCPWYGDHPVERQDRPNDDRRACNDMAGGGGWASPMRDREPADQPLQDPQPAIRRLASPPDARPGGATGVGVAVSAVVCSLHRGNVGPNRRFHLTIARAAVRTPALAKTEAAVSL